MLVLLAARYKAWFCGRVPSKIAGSNRVGDMDVCAMSVVCCQVEVSGTSRSHAQRIPTDCGASLCAIYVENTRMRRHRAALGRSDTGKSGNSLSFMEPEIL